MKITPDLTSLPQIVVVSGTDTGIGKTHTAAFLAQCWEALGHPVLYIKPVQTGVGKSCPLTGEEPEIPDAETVKKLVPAVRTVEGTRLAEPLAPLMAAELEGAELPPAISLVHWITQEASEHLKKHHSGRVIIESAGGLLVQFTHNLDSLQLTEALRNNPGSARDASPSVGLILVCHPGLGTLNQTELCLREASRARQAPYVIVGNWNEPSRTHELNREQLQKITEQWSHPAAWLGTTPEISCTLSPQVS